MSSDEQFEKVLVHSGAAQLTPPKSVNDIVN